MCLLGPSPLINDLRNGQFTHISHFASRIACERRRISGCRFGEKRQPEIRLRSQATSGSDCTVEGNHTHSNCLKIVFTLSLSNICFRIPTCLSGALYLQELKQLSTVPLFCTQRIYKDG